jgi:hypothetical protein
MLHRGLAIGALSMGITSLFRRGNGATHQSIDARLTIVARPRPMIAARRFSAHSRAASDLSKTDARVGKGKERV